MEISGSVKITATVVNDGIILTDDPADVMQIGPDTAPIEDVVVAGTGKFVCQDGQMTFGAVKLASSTDWFVQLPSATLRVSTQSADQGRSGDDFVASGTMIIEGEHQTSGELHVSGGLLQIDSGADFEVGPAVISGGTLDIDGVFKINGNADISAGDFDIAGQLTLEDPVVIGTISVPQHLTGGITMAGDLWGVITTAGDVSGTIDIAGQLVDTNGDLTRGHIIVNGSLQTGAAITVGGGFFGNTEFIAIDYDGWDEFDTWQAGATVTVSTNTYTENTPAARVWEISGILGDMNNDDALNGADIDPFFLALGDPNQYALDFPGLGGSRVWHGDCDCDGFFSGADIDPFFKLLGGGVPCAGFNFWEPEYVAWLIEAHVRPDRLDRAIELIGDYVGGEARPERRRFWNAVLDILAPS